MDSTTDALNMKDIYSEVGKIDKEYIYDTMNSDSRRRNKDNTSQRSRNMGSRQRTITSTCSRRTPTASGGRKSRKKPKKPKTLKLLKKRWEIPELPRLAEPHTSQYNSIDDATIYSRTRDERNDVLFETATPLLPPLKVSPRYKEQGPDPQHMKEKRLIMKYYQRTGKQKQFENDRAVIPTVYPDYFECGSRKKSYIADLYIREFIQKGKMSMECFGKSEKPTTTCQYCDVIGNKYCSFCIETKNRNFAWGYENNYVPIDAESRASVVKKSQEVLAFSPVKESKSSFK